MFNDLSNLHKLLLMIADEIDRICTKNQIPYTIASGTLLGAVRHEGFIPWDDDFDISMIRKDYIRFEKACQNELDTSKFFLQTESSEEFYPFSVEKLKCIRGKIITKYNRRETKTVFRSDFPKHIFPITLYDNYKKYKFEDREYYGMSAYNEYLTTLYGDYMKLPPPEKRIYHSNYEMNFGNYI